ncbi:MAG: acyltransferase [Alphaproteobacteria bacterium]|nr:acyltransferase [Alphaproteobacteria bacterium]
MNSFYTIDELKQLGLKSVGQNVKISKKCSIYGAKNISVGNNVRIDDFSILSGNIEIGDFVHISAYVALYGRGGIKIGNFCGISPRSTLFSASDDFSGEYMISPMVPDELTNLDVRPIVLNDYVQLGTSTTVMPGVNFGQGSVTGACSLVLKDTKPWTINIGIPCKFYKERARKIMDMAQKIK